MKWSMILKTTSQSVPLRALNFDNWLNTYPGWWFGTWILFFHSVGNSNPNWRTHIFFRGLGQPPTSIPRTCLIQESTTGGSGRHLSVGSSTFRTSQVPKVTPGCGLGKHNIPSGNLTKNYWKWWFIVYPLKMVIFHGYVSLPEGTFMIFHDIFSFSVFVISSLLNVRFLILHPNFDA